MISEKARKKISKYCKIKSYNEKKKTRRIGREKRLERNIPGTSLVAQCLGVCLPMQGRGFEPSSGRISHDAPVRHNYWNCALEPLSHSY